MKISIATMTHNEGAHVRELIDRVLKFNDFFELVIVDDCSTDPETLAVLESVSTLDNVKVWNRALNDDFASQKNWMTDKCSGDWILNLDADEWILSDLYDYLPAIIAENPAVEVYQMPRINVVYSLTLDHVKKWGWYLAPIPGLAPKIESYDPKLVELLTAFRIPYTEYGDDAIEFSMPGVVWPDYQTRLYKKADHIKWTGKVHETIVGAKMTAQFPADQFFAIRHYKSIERQEQQNARYEIIQR